MMTAHHRNKRFRTPIQVSAVTNLDLQVKVRGLRSGQHYRGRRRRDTKGRTGLDNNLEAECISAERAGGSTDEEQRVRRRAQQQRRLTAQH